MTSKGKNPESRRHGTQKKRTETCLPRLVIVNKTVSQLIGEFPGEGTLFVADPFNFSLVKNRGNAVLVTNRYHRITSAEPSSPAYERVVGIGGCSALDVGRLYGREHLFTGIPTILSTSCISVNISILRTMEGISREKTVIPDRTIIPLKTILATEKNTLRRFTSSGVGDLIANISAAIHYAYRKGSPSYSSIAHYAGEALEAVNWIVREFNGYNEAALRKIAHYLHNSSLEVIRRGNTELSAGFEHEFYEKIVERQKYSNEIQTHGILVALGTLVTTAIFERLYPGGALTSMLKLAFRKTGLPCSCGELAAIGIQRSHILDALDALRHTGNFVCRYIEERGDAVIDDALSEKG